MKSALALRLGLVMCLALLHIPAHADTVLFRDDFNGGRLNSASWGVGNWKLGRTQLGNVPVVAGGFAQLRFDTYQLAGTEIYTKSNFALGHGLVFATRVRMNNLPSGLVTALFTYQSQNSLSDEIDIECLSKQVNQSVGGAPLLLSDWNNWDEAHPAYDDGIHNSSRSVFVNSLNVNIFHTYEIHWLPGRTEWWLDGKLISSSTLAQPDLASPFRINLWAPASSWTDAFDAGLAPARSRRQNVSYYVDVDWVEIRALP
jgi:beta-glucanase (GH16 family)